jgi:hypothetical protein
MQRWLPIVLILALLIGFRILGSAYPETLPNFQPLAALFFCGAWLIGGWRGLALPLGLWLVTYPLPAIFQGNADYLTAGVMLTTLVALAATWAIGHRLKSAGPSLLLAGSLAAAVLFHLITNGAAWLGNPAYAKSLTGLWQSLWTGAPTDVLPTWVFLRNTLAANLIFTGLVLAARWRMPNPAPSTVPASAR